MLMICLNFHHMAASKVILTVLDWQIQFQHCLWTQIMLHLITCKLSSVLGRISLLSYVKICPQPYSWLTSVYSYVWSLELKSIMQVMLQITYIVFTHSSSISCIQSLGALFINNLPMLVVIEEKLGFQHIICITIPQKKPMRFGRSGKCLVCVKADIWKLLKDTHH